MVAEGCIHGRFQPFHIEHLEDALAALDRCGFLWIGLAEPFPVEQPAGPPRITSPPPQIHSPTTSASS